MCNIKSKFTKCGATCKYKKAVDNVNHGTNGLSLELDGIFK